jgi:gamma-glutamyltranspeptidase/glutathione hydrolase
LIAEIMARAFFERQYIADPLFSNFDVSQIYSDKRINDWVATIDENKKTPIDKKKFEIKEGGNTTHYVVVDSEGNAVTATTTVNTEYGSGVFTEKYGINLNNEMDDFTTRPGVPNVFGLTQGEANTVAPLKTPLSSMTPTLVEKNGKLFLALGAPGGPRIINAVFQTLYHSLVTDWNADQIVQAPRIHHQFSPDKITHDKTLTPDIIEELTHRGHSVALGPMAKVYLIKVLSDSKNGAHLEGAFDNRGEGGVVGY